MKCQKCGFLNQDDSNFCSNCGTCLCDVRITNDRKNDVSLKIPFWEKTWFVILLCVFLPPIGITVLWFVKRPKSLIGRIVLTVFLLFYLLFWFIFIIACVEVKEENETEIVQESTDYANEEVEEGSDLNEDFLSVFSKEVGDTIANKANDVLINQIGFKEIKFGRRLGDTSNYEITADGVDMVITAMQDYCRVFIPNTSNVFYEDGNVLMTAEEYAGKEINHDDAVVYYIMAQEIVKENLVNSESADFPSMTLNTNDIGFAKTGDTITVQSYVDSKNSLDATVRSEWTVQFIPLDMTTYTYEMKYANIGGNAVGTYTEIQ